jgi:hypothetical protein
VSKVIDTPVSKLSNRSKPYKMSAAATAIAALPAASAVIESDNSAPAAVMPVDELAAQLKSLSQSDLFKLQKQLTAQLERVSKIAAKPTKAKKASKKAANPNKSYDQLKKPRAWVNFVLQYALQNGWEAFSITQLKRNKDTKKVESEEIIDMPESECVDGVYYYKGSVDPTTGKGKTMITKHAMTLSKVYKTDKPELYEQFSTTYDEEAGNESAAASESESHSEVEPQAEAKPVVVRKTASQKSREAEEKKAAKEAEKAAAKAAKEAEKAAAKAAKEAEKEAAKAVKAEVKPKAESKPKAAAPAAPAPAAAAAKPVTAAKKPVTKKAAAAKVDNWVAPDEDGFHDWTWDAKLYFRNSKNHVFTQTADGQCGDWMGLWIPAELRFEMIETPAEYLGEEDSITVQP